MKYFLLIFAVVMGQSVLAADKKPLIADPIVEKAIRSKYSLNKPAGDLTKADLETVTWLYLSQRHWLFGSRRPIETQDILGLLANPEFDNSQSGGHMMVGSFLDHD